MKLELTDPSSSTTRCTICQSTHNVSVLILCETVSLPICECCLANLAIASIDRLKVLHSTIRPKLVAAN